MVISQPTDSPKARCFIYLRRSQDREDRQALSIEKQDIRVKQILARENLLAEYLPAEDRSAKRPGRPIFNDMMDRIERGEARYIAVWALSRLSRNAVDGGRVIYGLDSGKLLAIHTPGRTYRNTPDDKMMLAIEMAVAKKTNDDLSVHVREGFEAKRRRGQYPGPAPLGYVNSIIGPGQRNIVPDPIKAPLVVKLFEDASTGQYSLEQLMHRSSDMGLKAKTGGKLGKQTMVEVLKRRAYSGVFKYGGDQWHLGTYKPLISVELYDKVQFAMGWAKCRNKDRPDSTSGKFYPYKGLLVCDTCRFNITAYTKHKILADGKAANYVFYSCTKKNRQIMCEEPQIAAPLLEKEIYLKLKEFEISDEDARELDGYIRQLHASYTSKRNQYRPAWLKDRQDAEKALDVLDLKLEAGTISDERYRRRAGHHEAIMARTTELLESQDADTTLWLELASQTFSGVTNIGELFLEANDEEKRQLMTFVGSNWYLGMKKVDLTPRRPIDLFHNSNRNTIWRAVADEVWNYFSDIQLQVPVKG